MNNENVASSSVSGSLDSPSFLPKIGDRRGVNYDGDKSFNGNIDNMLINKFVKLSSAP